MEVDFVVRRKVVTGEDRSFIQNEIESEDPFVRILYKDLEDRLQIYETDGSGIERLKLSDLKTEFIMALVIAVFLIIVILQALV